METLNEEVIQTEEMGMFKRIINIVFEPSKVFRSIVEERKLLVPIILIAISLVLLAIPKAPMVEDYNRNLTGKIYKSEAFLSTVQITPEQADKSVESAAKISKIVSYFSPIMALVMLLLQALVFYLAFKILKGKGTFVQTFSVLVYAYLIKVLGEAVRTINVVISGKADVTNSFALLMPHSDKTSFVYNLVGSLDLFSIWALIVAALGLSIIHNVSKKKAYLTVFSLWIVYILGMAGYITFSAVSLYNKYGVTM